MSEISRTVVTVSDPLGGRFEVKDIGTITYLQGGGYSLSPGTTWASSEPSYWRVLGNLASASPQNQQTLIEVLGQGAVQKAIASVPESAVSTGSTEDAAQEKLWEKKWFWPVVIVSGVGLVATSIVLWPKR